MFVALDLDEAVRARVHRLLNELKGSAPEIKWVAPDSMHLTLKFIGEQPEARLAELAEALKAVPRPGPLALNFRGLGCFPNERHPRVFWIGVESPPELARLAEAIDGAMERFGIERECRAFSPHLTLGRTREGRRSFPGAGFDQAGGTRQVRGERVEVREPETPGAEIVTCLRFLPLATSHPNKTGHRSISNLSPLTSNLLPAFPTAA